MTSDLPAQLHFAATDAVRAVIAAMGRTEDVKFSPDGRRLAVACFASSKCLLFDIEMDFSSGRRSIVLGGVLEFSSPDLCEPHGLAFLDSDTLVVANRAGAVQIFRLPRRGSVTGRIELCAEWIDPGSAFRKVSWPGSVAAVPLGPGRHDILVCNNYTHRVTRHRLRWRDSPWIRKNKVLLEAALDIPDGLAVSPSRRWLAVSNHGTGSALIYRNRRLLGRRTEPEGQLVGAGYPHGLCFTGDGQFLLVADAGSPLVNVYLAIGDDWRGTRSPLLSFRVMSDETYRRGRKNPEEGGPKGLDIDAGMRVLATTCEEQPLAFFDLRAVLSLAARRSA